MAESTCWDMALEILKSVNALGKTRFAPNDELYTPYETVAAEMEHYRNSFRGKTVYLNCDDPGWSNIYRYFKDHFEELGLKKLITTHINFNGNSFKTEDYDGKKGSTVRTELDDNGDFMHHNRKKELDESDIIVTNPPFSLTRNHIKHALANNKKFISMGRETHPLQDDMFRLFEDGTVRVGVTEPSKFLTSHDGMQPHQYHRVGGSKWFTNMTPDTPHDTRFVPTVRYNSNNYQMSPDNTLIVGKYTDIPMDYKGVMRVPATYITHHNPDLFKIVGKGTWINPQTGRETFEKLLIAPKDYETEPFSYFRNGKRKEIKRLAAQQTSDGKPCG